MASRASRLASFLEQKPLRSYPWARPKKAKQPPQINRWNILRGDKVVVVNGRHRGQSGIVQKVLRSTNRLIVDDVNVVSVLGYHPHVCESLIRVCPGASHLTEKQSHVCQYLRGGSG